MLFLQSSKAFTFTVEGHSYKFNKDFVSVSFLPASIPGVMQEAIEIKIFQKISNVNIRFIFREPNLNITFVDHTINLCHYKNRRGNLFVRILTDYTIQNNVELIKCVYQKSVNIIPERKREAYATNMKTYIPPFIKLEGKIFVHHYAWAKDAKNVTVDLYASDEYWIFK